jgi:hypothetical protein
VIYLDPTFEPFQPFGVFEFFQPFGVFEFFQPFRVFQPFQPFGAFEALRALRVLGAFEARAPVCPPGHHRGPPGPGPAPAALRAVPRGARSALGPGA